MRAPARRSARGLAFAGKNDVGYAGWQGIVGPVRR